MYNRRHHQWIKHSVLQTVRTPLFSWLTVLKRKLEGRRSRSEGFLKKRKDRRGYLFLKTPVCEYLWSTVSLQCIAYQDWREAGCSKVSHWAWSQVLCGPLSNFLLDLSADFLSLYCRVRYRPCSVAWLVLAALMSFPFSSSMENQQANKPKNSMGSLKFITRTPQREHLLNIHTQFSNVIYLLNICRRKGEPDFKLHLFSFFFFVYIWRQFRIATHWISKS